jgi:hypothetical protein
MSLDNIPPGSILKLFTEYKKQRKHQLDTYGESGLHVQNSDGVFVSARQFVGGGAAYGFHALAAYDGARSHIFCMNDLKATLASYQKRSAAKEE